MVPALGVSVWLKRRRVSSFWPYVLAGGGLSWAAMFLGGIHPDALVQFTVGDRGEISMTATWSEEE